MKTKNHMKTEKRKKNRKTDEKQKEKCLASNGTLEAGHG